MWASGETGPIERAAHGYEPTREAALAAFAKSWDVSRPALPLARPLALEWAQRPARMCEIVSVPITVPVADETATTRLRGA